MGGTGAYSDQEPISHIITLQVKVSQIPTNLLFFLGVFSKEECEEPDSIKDATVINQTTVLRHWKWWLVVALNITLLISGQSTGVLLRLYHNLGGNSI